MDSGDEVEVDREQMHRNFPNDFNKEDLESGCSQLMNDYDNDEMSLCSSIDVSPSRMMKAEVRSASQNEQNQVATSEGAFLDENKQDPHGGADEDKSPVGHEDEPRSIELPTQNLPYSGVSPLKREDLQANYHLVQNRLQELYKKCKGQPSQGNQVTSRHALNSQRSTEEGCVTPAAIKTGSRHAFNSQISVDNSSVNRSAVTKTAQYSEKAPPYYRASQPNLQRPSGPRKVEDEDLSGLVNDEDFEWPDGLEDSHQPAHPPGHPAVEKPVDIRTPSREANKQPRQKSSGDFKKISREEKIPVKQTKTVAFTIYDVHKGMMEQTHVKPNEISDYGQDDDGSSAKRLQKKKASNEARMDYWESHVEQSMTDRRAAPPGYRYHPNKDEQLMHEHGNPQFSSQNQNLLLAGGKQLRPVLTDIGRHGYLTVQAHSSGQSSSQQFDGQGRYNPDGSPLNLSRQRPTSDLLQPILKDVASRKASQNWIQVTSSPKMKTNYSVQNSVDDIRMVQRQISSQLSSCDQSKHFSSPTQSMGGLEPLTPDPNPGSQSNLENSQLSQGSTDSAKLRRSARISSMVTKPKFQEEETEWETDRSNSDSESAKLGETGVQAKNPKSGPNRGSQQATSGHIPTSLRHLSVVQVRSKGKSAERKDSKKTVQSSKVQRSTNISKNDTASTGSSDSQDLFKTKTAGGRKTGRAQKPLPMQPPPSATPNSGDKSLQAEIGPGLAELETPVQRAGRNGTPVMSSQDSYDEEKSKMELSLPKTNRTELEPTPQQQEGTYEENRLEYFGSTEERVYSPDPMVTSTSQEDDYSATVEPAQGHHNANGGRNVASKRVADPQISANQPKAEGDGNRKDPVDPNLSGYPGFVSEASSTPAKRPKKTIGKKTTQKNVGHGELLHSGESNMAFDSSTRNNPSASESEKRSAVPHPSMKPQTNNEAGNRPHDDSVNKQKEKLLVSDSDSNDSFDVERKMREEINHDIITESENSLSNHAPTPIPDEFPDLFDESTPRPLAPVVVTGDNLVEMTPDKSYANLEPAEPKFKKLDDPCFPKNPTKSKSKSKPMRRPKSAPQVANSNGELHESKYDLFQCVLCPRRFSTAGELEAHAEAEGHVICSASDACASLRFDSKASLANHHAAVHQQQVSTAQKPVAQRKPQDNGEYEDSKMEFNGSPSPKLNASKAAVTPKSANASQNQAAKPSPCVPKLPAGIQLTKRPALSIEPVHSPRKIVRFENGMAEVRLSDSITLVKSKSVAAAPPNNVAGMLASRGVTISGGNPNRLPNLPPGISVSTSGSSSSKFAVPPVPAPARGRPPMANGNHLTTATKTGNTKQTTPPKSNNQAKRFPCTVCDKLFPNPDTLAAHMAVHGTKKFTCEMCRVVYANQAKLAQHMRAVHPKPAQPEFVIPICDLSQLGVKQKLLQSGIRHVVQLSNLRNANDTATFGLPIIPIDLAKNDAFSRLDDLGASNILSLGHLEALNR